MSQTPAQGTFIRRKRDGMIGRVGRTWGYQASASYRHQQTDVVWIGEWSVAQLAKAGAHEVLAGADAQAAADRFDALTCKRCGGTGKLDPFTQCPVDECHLGRLLGIEPDFDAAYTRYQRLLDSEMNRDRNRYVKTDAAAEREMDLRYPATCTECGTRMAADTTALGRKEAGSWRFRCAKHAA